MGSEKTRAEKSAVQGGFRIGTGIKEEMVVYNLFGMVRNMKSRYNTSGM
jgi:hypothetical protein